MLFISLLFSAICFSQNTQSDIVFAEGLYLNFDDVLSGKSVSLTRIINPDPVSYAEVTKAENIDYINDLGVKSTVSTDKIWGYADKGTLYARINKEFHRITMIGTISHLFVNEKYYQQGNYDPYYYGYGYPMSSPTYEANRLVQYIIDFKTGNILPMDTGTLEILLSADSEIFNEYIALKKRKRKQMMLMYIRKFNEKHPLIISQQK